MARFHRYSLHNVCLIVAQRPTATRVAGFHTWRTLGRFVRKGEKGIAILAPIVARRRDETEEDESRTVVGFRAAYVFDVEQTDGAPLPQPSEAAGDPGDADRTPEGRDRCSQASLSSTPTTWAARSGSPAADAFECLTGSIRASEFAVLTHEYAHELLHRGSDRPESRDTRELEAEAVAFVVGQAIGLEVADASRDYIHLYSGDSAALTASLERIQRTASSILQSIRFGEKAIRDAAVTERMSAD